MKQRNLINKIINIKPSMYSQSLILNSLGMQWYRIFFFWCRRVLRTPKGIPMQYAEYLKALERDGVVAIPNFFSEEEFSRIRQEYQSLQPYFRRDDAEVPIPHVERITIHDKLVPTQVRNLFTKNPMIHGIATAYLNRPFNPPLDARFTKIYCNQQELDLPKNGGTNNLHFDAPTRVLKGFYFLSDADQNNGTFTYCLGSQKRNRLKRLLFEYRLSVRYAHNRGNSSHGGEYMDGEPWVKITQEEMKRHGLVETPIAVKANTMLFANTGGFHRRGTFLQPGIRETVEINYRGIESPRNTLYYIKNALASFTRVFRA